MANDEQSPNEITVVNVPESGRYELRDGAKTIGLAEYRVRPGRIIFTHTEVDPGYGGQGLGSMFAKHVLDEAAAGGQRIVPVCPFIAAYLRKNHDYDEFVDWPVTDAGETPESLAGG